MKLSGLLCALVLAAVFFVACASVSAFSSEQALDLLAAKTQAKLNAYFNTTKIVFAKQADFVYGTTFTYIASYRITPDKWRGDFFINMGNDLGLLKKGKAFNGFNVQFNDDPSELLLGFFCDDSSHSGVSYLVYAELAKQPDVSGDAVADALTLACAEFQSEAAQYSGVVSPAASAAAPSSASACVRQGDECCRGAVCKRVTQNACAAGQAPRVTGCNVLCAPQTVCDLFGQSGAASVEPNAAEPSAPAYVEPSAFGQPSQAPPAAASVAAPSTAPGEGAAQQSAFDWVYWVAAGVIVVALVYWFFFRGENGGGGGAGGDGVEARRSRERRKKKD